ncbi:MAG TPA: amino acid adenylation domain-containing protein [Gemmataceae bacterium]
MLLADLLHEKARQEASSPLAHGQRGLWFLYQLDRASAAYNIFFPARIRTRLDVPAFRQALQTLIDRHPGLRTTFEEHGGDLRQCVHDKLPVALEVLDASSWSEETLRRRVEEEAYRPFDLQRGPLVRMHLFTRSADEHIFLFTAHHIVGDFWSLVLLMEEMQSLYPSRGANATPLAAPQDGYRDFVRWQANMLAGPDGERLWSYWSKQLDDVPPVLELPTDRPRPAIFTDRGAALPCRIAPELTRRLKTLAAAEGVTLYTVLLAAFQVLIGRHTGQDDFIIGSPFAGRSRPEFEKIVGCFINMLPLRANLSGDPTFRTLLRQTGSTVLEALQHQDYPFALLVERLNLKRDPSRAPLVQASFTLERAHRPVGMGSWSFFLPEGEVRLNVAGLRAEPYHVEHRTCQMDLEMILEEADGGLYGMMRYSVDLFDEVTIRRLATHYQVLLKGAIEDPECHVSELSLLTSAEERQVLREWNDTAADYPRDVCLHQLFEMQATKTPSAIALRCGEASLCYDELDARANRLAHRLHRLGIGPNTPVALCLERSPEMVTAMLAVLKAGGAYVPLDPASPVERLHTILADTRAPVLLTQRQFLDRAVDLKIEIILVDDESERDAERRDVRSHAERGNEEAKPPSSGVQANDLAYIIYTSGSTGRPKGVMVEHRAICNTIFWHWRVLTVHEDDRMLLLVPYVFDASLCIIFPALAAGATLILAQPGEERDPARVLERVQRDGVTILPILPRMLRLMLDDRMREAGRSLRWVCCGGEAMPPDLPNRLFALLDVPLYNLYGPTETAIDATYWPCRRGEDQAIIPIGRPIANVQVYVLDRHHRPLPVGVPGELYIGGVGLARGYLNDPQLTAERFVSDPFSDVPGARLYRTGDRCRWLSDGSVEFLGRLDQQVKLRGYRIETGEIEAALTAHPAVHESAVLVRTDDAAGQRLVAYVSARDGGDAPTAERLRRYLGERLPEYMVPSAFVLLPSLPHMATGKVDRRSLPAPPAERPETAHPYVAPRTPLEEFLAGLWRELLGLRQIGVLDNFFELGGNSIQAAVLVNRLQEHLDEQIYTVALFDSPTIAGLARYLADIRPEAVGRLFGPESLLAKDDKENKPGAPTTGADSPSLALRANPLLIPLQPNGSRTPCFMVHPPGGVVVCYQALAQRLGDDRPFYGIRAHGLHGETELPERLEDMAAEYVSAIRTVQPQGPYHLGGWSLGGVTAYEMAQQLLAQGQSIGLLALLDTTIPHNAANQPYAEDADESAREYGLDMTLEELDQLGPDEQLPYLWQHVQKLGLVDADTPMTLVQQILDDVKRLFHTHIKLGTEYALRPYPGRIALFRPTDSPIRDSAQKDRNWGKLAAVDIHFVPGLHHTMVKEPHVQVLARQLRLCLRQAEENDKHRPQSL